MEPPLDPQPQPAEPVGSVRERGRTPVAERSQRMHRFSATLLAALDDATAGGMDGVAVGCLTPREAGETVLELREAVARLQGLQLAVLAHADAGGISSHAAGPATVDTAAWLACAGLTDPGAARREVRLSATLSDELTATGSALLAGDLDRAQADVIATSIARLPRWVSAEQRATAEKTMLEHALRLDAAQLRRVGRHLLAVIDPEGAEAAEARRLQAEEDDAARTTSFSTFDDHHGTTHVFAKVPTRHGQMLRKIVEAIANPQLPDAITRTEPGTETNAEAGTPRQPRPTPEVLGEAFCRLVETLEPDRLPTSGGLNATVVVTMTLETLLGGLGAATLDTGAELSPGQARRTACAAGIVPAVLGGASEILDLGRTRRLFTKPQRLAMAIRQSHRCAADGCDRPTAWCDAHHLQPWSEGGTTDLADGVLICARHHTLAHHPDYQVQRQPGHRITITRKPRDTPLRR